jgi:hypothetical protein
MRYYISSHTGIRSHALPLKVQTSESESTGSSIARGRKIHMENGICSPLLDIYLDEPATGIATERMPVKV